MKILDLLKHCVTVSLLMGINLSLANPDPDPEPDSEIENLKTLFLKLKIPPTFALYWVHLVFEEKPRTLHFEGREEGSILSLSQASTLMDIQQNITLFQEAIDGVATLLDTSFSTKELMEGFNTGNLLDKIENLINYTQNTDTLEIIKPVKEVITKLFGAWGAGIEEAEIDSVFNREDLLLVLSQASNEKSIRLNEKESLMSAIEHLKTYLKEETPKTYAELIIRCCSFIINYLENKTTQQSVDLLEQLQTPMLNLFQGNPATKIAFCPVWKQFIYQCFENYSGMCESLQVALFASFMKISKIEANHFKQVLYGKLKNIYTKSKLIKKDVQSKIGSEAKAENLSDSWNEYQKCILASEPLMKSLWEKLNIEEETKTQFFTQMQYTQQENDSISKEFKKLFPEQGVFKSANAKMVLNLNKNILSCINEDNTRIKALDGIINETANFLFSIIQEYFTKPPL